MQDVVFLVDVDNTLLDNDGVIADLRDHLLREFGHVRAERYWHFFDRLREELGYTDYLGALQRFRLDQDGDHINDRSLLQMSSFLIDYPFADRLYPDALGALAHLKQLAPTVILTDGDAVFQPRKVRRSGIWDAADGEVLIYVHKELSLDAVERRYPARHYVAVDDKLRILAAMKKQLGDRLTTVFPRQGSYAHDPNAIASYPAADLTVEAVADLRALSLAELTRARPAVATP